MNRRPVHASALLQTDLRAALGCLQRARLLCTGVLELPFEGRATPSPWAPPSSGLLRHQAAVGLTTADQASFLTRLYHLRVLTHSFTFKKSSSVETQEFWDFRFSHLSKAGVVHAACSHPRDTQASVWGLGEENSTASILVSYSLT